MTQEEKRQYAKEYRAEGFGAINDRRYYLSHREECLRKQRVRDARKKALKLSQDKDNTTPSLENVIKMS